MPDLSHFFGNDLTTDQSGDLATADGDDETTQRVLRRLLTSQASSKLAADDIWNPTYGAGLRRMIGRALPVPQIVGVIRSQLFFENGVAQRPAPAISITPNPNGVFNTNIEYTSATSATPMLLNFDLPVV